MALLQFVPVGGANLALHPMALPPGAGVDSRNARPGRGDLRPLLAPSTVATVLTTGQTIYRMGRTAPSDSSYWLAWAADVDVARGFIAEDSTERTFWTGDGVPKWTDNTIGLGSPPYPDSSGVRLLGVPAPNADPTLAETVAGAGTDETRAYVVTWVNDRGEESMPSGAATITCKPGATIRVTRNATVPSGAYGLTTWRVYRTVAGNDTDYFYVGETTAATAFLDTTDGTLNTASPLLSEGWAVPPSTLKGLKALWNGIMVGFYGKALCFSEPFRPYAWPVAYQIPLDDDIVGLARIGLSLLVLTVGRPHIVTGSSPGAMSAQALDFNQACVAKKGIVEFGHGAVWPSPDGLAYVGANGQRVLLTNPDGAANAAVAEREDWQLLVPSTIVAGENEGLYVASYDDGGGRESFVFDPLAPADGFRFCDPGFVACFRDVIGDKFFILQSGSTGSVQKWNSGSALTASFKSRVERVGRPTNFGHAQIVADAYPVSFWLWAQGAAKVTALSVTGAGSFRLPAGFRADQWQIQVATALAGGVQLVQIAHTADELNRA